MRTPFELFSSTEHVVDVTYSAVATVIDGGYDERVPCSDAFADLQSALG